MKLRNTGIIIRREYLNRVKKKSFIILTFVVPILFAAMCLLPSLIMVLAKEESKQIAVCDASGLVAGTLKDTETAKYIDMSSSCPDSLKLQLEDLGLDALMVVSPLDSATKTVSAVMYSNKPVGVEMTENIEGYVNDAIENYRIESYGIDGLSDIMKEVTPNIKITSYTLDEEGKESISESGIYMIVSMVLGMLIYMFIAMFGGMVMSSVIEEKSSRVVEVLVSSVKATELMFGKIIGIALVALTQFLLWIVLTFAIVGVVGVAVGGKAALSGTDTAQIVEMAGVSPDQADAVTAAVSEPGTMNVVLSTLSNMPIAEILVSFVIYFIFGYMLYASLFAAIGSAVENEGDSQQLQLPVTIPILLGFFIAIYAFKAPDSALVFWGSMIPFTSPIVMLARLPFGVQAWELILSIALLIGCFVLCAWASAKIYKVGILMFGKKSTWKDLWKWFKQN